MARPFLRPALALAAIGLSAQEAPLPPVPSANKDEGPNPDFRAELEAAVAGLKPDQVKPFFHALRKAERDLRLRIEFTRSTLIQARKLQKNLEAQDAPTVKKAQSVVASEEARLKAYRDMRQAIDEVRHRLDPQRIDAGDLQVDLYGGFMFSSLYEDSAQNASFFSKSRPFASLDIRQSFRRPGSDAWVESFSTLSFQSSSVEQSDTVNVITSSGEFRAEAGSWWLNPFTENVSWGVIGSVGLVGASQPQAQNQGLASSNRDSFRGTARLSLTIRQEQGSLKGSFAEWGYLRDPLFLKRDRLFVRGRVVLTQLGSEGANGDFYMEGSVNKGTSGRDEAILLVGVRLSTLAFLRSLGGAPQP